MPYGEHELEVRAKGPMGAVDLTPAAWSWASGDVTPPVVTIHAGPLSATIDTTATFTFSVDDPDASLRCSLDGAVLDCCESPVTYTEADLARGNGHSSGPHTFEVIAEKPNLLVESLPAVWEWTVDDISDPTTEIESGPPAEISSELPSLFTFSSNEPGAMFECALDPLAIPEFTSCAAPPDNLAEFSGLLPGDHVLLVRAVDPSLNTDPTPAEFRWPVVGAALTTIVGNVPADPQTTILTSATFSFSADQPSVTFMCSLDGAEFAPCTSPVSLTDVSVGNHTFEVQSTNPYLLIEEPPALFSWNVEVPVDIELPDTTIDSFPLDPTTDADPRFTFSADQFNATYQCSLDLASFTACTSPQSYNDLPEGDHIFQVRAVHPIGIPDQSPAVHEWTIDLVPDTFIDEGPPSQTLNPNAVFFFRSNEGFASFQCALDVPTYGSCPGDGQFLDLLVGSHVLRVRAVDPGGNIDPTPAVHRWTIGPLPDTFVNSGPEEVTQDRTATFVFGSNLPGVRFECALDEATEDLFFLPCPQTYVLEDLIWGEHELLVRAVDPAGNVDPVPAEWSWEIGGVPPPVLIETGPDLTTDHRSARFTWSADGEDLLFECALDTGNTTHVCQARPTTACRSARTSSRSASSSASTPSPMLRYRPGSGRSPTQAVWTRQLPSVRRT